MLHLLYARFWHKVLFDLGHVSTVEPFARLFNQGYIQAYAFTDERGTYVEAGEVVERDGGYVHNDEPVNREYGKMGKSLKNVVTPDDIYRDYGADTLRLYEMFMRRDVRRAAWFLWMRPLDAALLSRFWAVRTASSAFSVPCSTAVRADFTRVFSSERVAWLRSWRTRFCLFRFFWLLMFATARTYSRKTCGKDSPGRTHRSPVGTEPG